MSTQPPELFAQKGELKARKATRRGPLPFRTLHAAATDAHLHAANHAVEKAEEHISSSQPQKLPMQRLRACSPCLSHK